EKEIKLFLCNNPRRNPYYGIPKISKFWENVNNQGKEYWRAPDGLFWICGKRTYPKLPPLWKGSCALGIIQPGFFLLPNQDRKNLGTPV
ncbi:ENR1 protein, partial [Promerops cafer]|nr:ENR1 protein [Promerops cafer]